MIFVELIALCVLVGGAVCGWLYLFKMISSERRLKVCENKVTAHDKLLSSVMASLKLRGDNK